MIYCCYRGVDNFLGLGGAKGKDKRTAIWFKGEGAGGQGTQYKTRTKTDHG